MLIRVYGGGGACIKKSGCEGGGGGYNVGCSCGYVGGAKEMGMSVQGQVPDCIAEALLKTVRRTETHRAHTNIRTYKNTPETHRETLSHRYIQNIDRHTDTEAHIYL